MIEILETRVQMQMTLPEFRVLTKVLGVQSVHRLMNTDGLDEREIKVWGEMYAACASLIKEHELR